MDNIITATFNDYTYARTTSLWQYDYGQILQIEGITLPATFEVHFSNQDQEGESLIQIGAVQDKTAQVQILTASSGRAQEAITVSMHSSILQILNLEKQNTRSQSRSGKTKAKHRSCRCTGGKEILPGGDRRSKQCC